MNKTVNFKSHIFVQDMKTGQDTYNAVWLHIGHSPSQTSLVQIINSNIGIQYLEISLAGDAGHTKDTIYFHIHLEHNLSFLNSILITSYLMSLDSFSLTTSIIYLEYCYSHEKQQPKLLLSFRITKVIHLYESGCDIFRRNTYCTISFF